MAIEHFSASLPRQPVHFGKMPNVVPFSLHKTVILFVKICQIQFCLECAAGLTVLSIHVTLITPSPCDVNYTHTGPMLRALHQAVELIQPLVSVYI